MYTRKIFEPIISITVAGKNKIRFRIGIEVMRRFGGTHVLFDKDAMTLTPHTENTKPLGAVKINDRSQFVIHQIDRPEKYDGRYLAIWNETASLWQLGNTKNTENNFVDLEEIDSYPYRITFPDYKIVNGFFKMI